LTEVIDLAFKDLEVVNKDVKISALKEIGETEMKFLVKEAAVKATKH